MKSNFLLKLVIFSILFLLNDSWIVFSQNKKEVIEQQALRIDSLSKILTSFQADFLIQQTTIKNQADLIAILRKNCENSETETLLLKKEVAGLKSLKGDIEKELEKNTVNNRKAIDSLSINRSSKNEKCFFLEYSNQMGEVKVPDGKIWYIAGCFAQNNLSNEQCETKVCIAKLNSKILSNISSNMFADNFFESKLDMYLPSGTSISFLVYDKCADSNYNYSRKAIDKKVTLNIVEYSVD